MALICVACEQEIGDSDYRMIGVEKGTWMSRYAHINCIDEARRRFTPPTSRVTVVNPQPALVMEAEELTMEAPDPFPDTEGPWFGMERRR